MKKTFCDVCGAEFSYEEKEYRDTAGTKTFTLIGQENKKIAVKVRLDIEAENLNGEHIDICGDCRLYIANKLDTRPRASE